MTIIDKIRNCYICKSEKVCLYKKVNIFSILKCKSCGLKWIGEINEDLIKSFYNESYFKSEKKIGYKNYLEDEKNHRKNAKSILYLVNKIKRLNNLKILDIGCAFGFLLDEARKLMGCDTYGIETSQFAFEYAKYQLELNVLNFEVNESNFEDKFFDTVFLIGTIEHLIDPYKMLVNINRILKDDGLLVITTIDTRGFIPFYSIKPPEHIFYFNHNNLSLLINNSGFECYLHKTYFVNYYVHDLCHRFIEYKSWSSLRFLTRFIRILPKVSIKIPTNEMLVIARKCGNL
jgi:2-polyprenyl-3-methyl-5-hydroxy-6-metoxy-1,4-benzoquinol methylase